MKIVFSPEYDIHFMGIEKLHPFDTRKYSKAWQLLHKSHSSVLESATIIPTTEITDDELLTVHTHDYLASLQSSDYLALALEFPPLQFLPYYLIKKHLIKPMKLATKGSLIAADMAVKHGISFNFGGGYHHASEEKAEGFCLFSDIAIVVAWLRKSRRISHSQQAMIIDLDAHQGNGYERIFLDDDDIFIFDMYNRDIYPQDTLAKQAINHDVPLSSGYETVAYLEKLTISLNKAFDRANQPAFVIYIAGTDIYKHDVLGKLNVTETGILQRDKFVIDLCTEKQIPLLILTGGGYSPDSYRMIANTADYLLRR